MAERKEELKSLLMKVKEESEKPGLKQRSYCPTLAFSHIETCILPYVKQMIGASSMHEARHSKLVLWDNPEGWGREESGSGVQDGGTHVHPWLIYVGVWQKPPQYCKVISL